MEFSFTEKEAAFRKEVREFIQRETPPRWRELDPWLWEESDEIVALARGFQRKLAQKGWLAPKYPKEYGGMAATQWERVILAEELAYHRAPVGLEVEISVDWVGPSILLFGTEEQKKKYVGGIGRGELLFCLGYSEPDSGSDLASLKTTAVEKEDCYFINGQKIWTTYGQYADYIWLAARTDSNVAKHKGISLFIVDAKTPGITINPIINMVGCKSFTEVFFDNVRIPKDSLVGEKNRGWYQLMAALTFERSGVALLAESKRIIDDLVMYAKSTKDKDGFLIDDPIIRSKLADLAIQQEVGRLLSYRVVSMQEKGRGYTANAEASVNMAFQTELHRHVANTCMDILGLVGQLDRGNKWVALGARIMKFYLFTVATGVGGGTREVQRNIIALRGLGLPDL